MAHNRTELLRGTLDMMILKALSAGPRHGYAVARWIGLAPGLQVSHTGTHASLKEGGRTSATPGRRPRLRQALVIAELALAVVLLAGAGLLINSFIRLRSVDPGFHARNVLVVPISLPVASYPGDDWPRTIAFFDRLIERLRSQPGVEAASAAYQHPLAGGWETAFTLPGVFEPPEGQRPEARIRPVKHGYFETVQIPLLEGRTFTERDREDAPGVAIINDAFARAFFPNGSPLGHTIERSPWWPFQSRQWEIVGVVGDVKMDGMAASTPWAMYFPHDQVPFNDMHVLVRTSGDPMALADFARQEIRALDPLLPVDRIRSLDEIRGDSMAEQRFQSLLLGGFAALALVLAAVGIYGVLSYTVTQRTSEIGLRISLGARADDVLRMVLRQGIGLVLIGLAMGLVGALAPHTADREPALRRRRRRSPDPRGRDARPPDRRAGRLRGPRSASHARGPDGGAAGRVMGTSRSAGETWRARAT